MKNYAGKIMRWTLLSLVVVVVYVVSITPWQIAQAVPTITSTIIDDWSAVAAQATDESTVIDISGNYATSVHIQAFLDANQVAHEGTEFRIQVSGMSSGDEDWADLVGGGFLALVGTAKAEKIDNNPLNSSSSTIVVLNTAGLYETEPMGKWIAIEDGTLINSELCWQIGYTTDDDITVLDGTTNSHVQYTLLWDMAISRTLVIPFGSGYRARVICNNGIDLDGTASTLNWKVGKTVTTDMNE